MVVDIAIYSYIYLYCKKGYILYTYLFVYTCISLFKLRKTVGNIVCPKH